MFCNEWLWEFFPEGFACLGTGATRAPCFVMNGCGNSFQKGLLV